jgi:hypothetical protein
MTAIEQQLAETVSVTITVTVDRQDAARVLTAMEEAAGRHDADLIEYAVTDDDGNDITDQADTGQQSLALD